MLLVSSNLSASSSSWINQSDCLLEDFRATHISTNKYVHIILAVFLSALTAFSILANAVVFIALVLSRATRRIGRQNSSRSENALSVMLMAAMAFADFALGVVVLPQALVVIVNDPPDDNTLKFSKIRGSLNVFWCTVSMYNMTSLAVYRYIAACWPFLYRSMFARRKYFLFGVYIAAPLLISTIAMATGFRLLSLYHDNVCGYLYLYTQGQTMFIINASISLYIPMSAMLFLYYKVFRKINGRRKISTVVSRHHDAQTCTVFRPKTNHKQSTNRTSAYWDGKVLPVTLSKLETCTFYAKSPSVISVDKQVFYTSGYGNRNATLGVNDVEKTQAAEVVTVSNSEDVGQTKLQGTMQTNSVTQTSSRIKSERTIAMVVVGFIVCTIPLNVATTVSFFTGTPLPTWVVLFVTWMCYGNSALNPVLFCWHREVWHCVKSFLHIK